MELLSKTQIEFSTSIGFIRTHPTLPWMRIYELTLLITSCFNPHFRASLRRLLFSPISFALKPHSSPKPNHYFLSISLFRFSNLQIPKGFLRLFWQWGVRVSTMATPLSKIEAHDVGLSSLLTMPRAWCWPFPLISFIGVSFVSKRKSFEESRCFLGLAFPQKIKIQICVMDFGVFDTYVQ